MSMKCPTCGRLTYSQKWNVCSACLGEQALRNSSNNVTRNVTPEEIRAADPLEVPVSAPDTTKTPKADALAVEAIRQGKVAPRFPLNQKAGRPQQYANPAEKQRAYRARKKAQG